MNSRNEILNRLRQVNYRSKDLSQAEWGDHSLYLNYPEKSEDLFKAFKNQLEDLSGEVHLLQKLDDFESTFLEIFKDIDPLLCRAHQSPLIENLKISNPRLTDYFEYIDGKNIDNVPFSEFEIGISCVDALIARTGSILLRTLSAGGRRLSVLPPTHVVIAESNQLVYSIDEALKNLKDTKNDWSYATIITGPSRTADIEKQLVLGAHGPKRLVVFVINSK